MLIRQLVVPGDTARTVTYCVEQLVRVVTESVAARGVCTLALSGGSTPRAIIEKLCAPPYAARLPWDKLHLFWSDERAVPPTHEDSNYHMAMTAGLSRMPLLPAHIHRMRAEEQIEDNARRYEEEIRATLQGRPFDLITLGVGEDGHTASLFPHTPALKETSRWVVAQLVPQKGAWRMTFTYPCLHNTRHLIFYALGKSKQLILKELFTEGSPDYPAAHVGTPSCKALWIADQAAAEGIKR